MSVYGVFSHRYQKNQIGKKLTRTNVGCAIYVRLKFKSSFNVTFVETSNGHNFFPKYLLEAILLWNLLIFLDLRGRLNFFFRFNFHFFLIILPYIWLKIDKRKTISPMTVCGIFSRRYKKNHFGKKIASIRHRMRVLYPFEIQIFTSTPLT